MPQDTGNPLVREQRFVRLDDKLYTKNRETWRIEWQATPRPFCDINDSHAGTCSCNGFAYGEAGKAELVRLKGEHEIERMPLAPLFYGEGTDTGGDAVFSRWPRQDADLKAAEYDGFTAKVAIRPLTPLMLLGDYDHDGRATEFFLQTDTLPCGKRMGVVVGLSPGNAHLHAFATTAHPERPLVLADYVWEALRYTRKNTVTEVFWRCGDHGAQTQTEITLTLMHPGIRVLAKAYACAKDGTRGHLIKEKLL